MAAKLSAGLAELNGVELAYPTQSNEVFVKISDEILQSLQAQNIFVNDEELDGSAIRFVGAWNTDPAEIDRLLAVIKQHSESF